MKKVIDYSRADIPEYELSIDSFKKFYRNLTQHNQPIGECRALTSEEIWLYREYCHYFFEELTKKSWWQIWK